MLSAKRLSGRRRWRRQRGHDGHARVAVPATEATPREPIAADIAADIEGDDAGDINLNIARISNSFDGALTALREQLSTANQRADRGEARAEAAEAGRAGADAQIAVMGVEIEALKIQLAAVQTAAEAAAERRRQDDVRKARGLLARLRAAVRGG